MTFVENDSFRNLRRPPTDAFRSIPRLPREDVVLPVAASDLVAWYPFRSGTGEDITAGDSNFGDATDYSATVNGATFKPSGGTTDTKTGANSGAFDLDGGDDTLDLGTVADSDQSLTVTLWIKPDTVSKTTRVLSKRDPNNRKAGNFLIDIVSTLPGSPGRLILQDRAKIFGSSLTSDQYAHLAARYDVTAGTAELFVNGQSVGTDTFSQQIPASSSQPWRIGESKPANGGLFFDGTVDGVRIYQAALSDSQINQIYLNTKP